MDAEENRASGEEAATAETAATTQVPREGELAAILDAITQINGRLGNMDARLEAVESQLHTLPVKRERLATKVASTSVSNRFESLKIKKGAGRKNQRRDREKARSTRDVWKG
ncbi:hypothetical protein MTO96_033225 [Rhipicephalus appendiculatus]